MFAQTHNVIASLPMYDFPEVRCATDALWRIMVRHLLREGVVRTPTHLVHDRHLNHLWSDPDLFISQCCGYDILHRYKHQLQVLATPWFDVPGCCGGNYASTIVVPGHSQYRDVVDMFGTVAVINGPESHSGMNALLALVGPFARGTKFFSAIRISGSHAASLEALQNGEADVACVDCVTYALLRRYRPHATAGTHPLGLTYPAPAPPYVTRTEVNGDMLTRMQNALLATFDDPAAVDARRTLFLTGVELATAETYQRIATEFKHDLRAV